MAKKIANATATELLDLLVSEGKLDADQVDDAMKDLISSGNVTRKGSGGPGRSSEREWVSPQQKLVYDRGRALKEDFKEFLKGNENARFFANMLVEIDGVDLMVEPGIVFKNNKAILDSFEVDGTNKEDES